jgi:hypothetical protein
MHANVEPRFHIAEHLGTVTYAAIAAFGGVAKYLKEYLAGASFSIQLLLANTVVSGFSGYMFAQVALIMKPDWAFVVAGMGGFAGSAAMDFAFALFKKFAERRLEVK